LGMKQVVPNPWDVIAEKYPVGTTIEGKIKNITDFGLFIGIDEGIDGLVHISDMSWTKRIRHPSELYKKGDEVQAVVLNIDKENERFALGIKQLQRDPWEAVPERYKVGSKITGTVTNVTDFGVFVELEEGLVHVSEVTAEKLKTPLGRFHVGEVVGAKVLNINPKERRIGLSMKQIEADEEHDLVADYLSNYQGAPSSLGEVLKENLRERAADEGAAAQAAEESSETVQGTEGEVRESEEQGEEADSISETEGMTDQTASENERQTEATPSGRDDDTPSQAGTETTGPATEEATDAASQEKETDHDG
jgi:small subunit ribosomal protein S1